MNYLETGLPHTDFFPKKTNFRPPRYIPLCSLGRKYLGLEPLTRGEVQKIISRLCQPKQRKQDQEYEIRPPREDELRTGSNRRFVGRKRMSSLQIEKMVERLYSKRKTKDFQFVDNTFDAKDFVNMTDRDDSDDENNDDEVFCMRTDSKRGNLSKQRGNYLDKDSEIRMRLDNDINLSFEDKNNVATKTDIGSSDIAHRKTDACRDRIFGDNIRSNLQKSQTLSVSNSKGRYLEISRENNGLVQRDENRKDIHLKVQSNTETQIMPNGRVEPCMFRSNVPWTKRTETVSRQINSVRRPLSNPVFETSQHPLNIREDRSPRPEYTVTRCSSSLPRLNTKRRANNSQTPTEAHFIDQVATSNTPRGR